jgi:ATP-dependent helicase HrpA
LRANLSLIEEVHELEARSRRRDLLVEEQVLESFYDERLPLEVHDWPSLRRWLKQGSGAAGDSLRMKRQDVLARDPDRGALEAFPDRVQLRGLPLVLEYHFDPGGERDGATLLLPLGLINQVRAADLDWLIPGWREDKAIALIRSLPKHLRRQFVPAPDFARACLESIEPGGRSLVDALATELRRITGIEVPPDAWRREQIPKYLNVTVRLVDSDNSTVDESDDLDVLRERHGSLATAAVSDAESALWPSRRTRCWDFDSVPESVEVERFGLSMQAFPVLVDHGSEVELALHDDATRAAELNREGIGRLIMLRLPQQVEGIRRLQAIPRLCLLYRRFGDCDALRNALVRLAMESAFKLSERLPRTRAAFEGCCDAGRAELRGAGEAWLEILSEVLEIHHRIRVDLDRGLNPVLLKAATEINEQLAFLMPEKFASRVPPQWLRQFPRYLRAIELRLGKLRQGNPRDPKLSAALRPYWERYRARVPEPGGERGHAALEHYRWMLEEYRVSLFSQDLGTAVPVSPERLERQWEEVERGRRA